MASQSSPPAQSDTHESRGNVVYCHDLDRDIVQKTLAHRCEGNIVSEEKAALIDADRRRDRARRLRRLPEEEQPARRGATSYGTAFPAGQPGQYLTAKHTVEGCRDIALVTSEGEGYEAEIAAMDSKRDIALLSSPGRLRPFPLATASPANDTIAQAIGYSNQGLPVIRPLSVPAKILGHGDTAGQGSMIAFAGDIRAGASGGPLLDSNGQVIGMIVGKINTPAVYAEIGRFVRDVNFAVDALELQGFLEGQDSSAPKAHTAERGEDPGRRVLRVICDS